MKLILNLGRKLPEPIKMIFSKIYYGYFFNLDNDMVKSLAEYSNITDKETRWLLKSAEKIEAAMWRVQNPKTKKEVERFYKESPFYIFGLAFWHMKQYQKEFRKEIIRFAQGKVLDFGGGIGDMCIELKKNGFDCQYADISGRIFDFAAWLFQKRNYRVKMIDLSRQKILEKYDTIYCIDVIEHVLNPKEILNNISLHLKKNGRLIITNLNISASKEYHPMHFPTNFITTEYLNSLGLYKGEKPWLWIKSEIDTK